MYTTIYENFDNKRQLYTWKFTISIDNNYEDTVTNILTKKTEDLINQIDPFIDKDFKAYPEMDPKLEPTIESQIIGSNLTVSYKIFLIKIEITHKFKDSSDEPDLTLDVDFSN